MPQFDTANHQYDMSDFNSLVTAMRFIEDNWRLPRISGSYDSLAGTLSTMFNFHQRQGHHHGTLFLNPLTGQPAKTSAHGQASG